MRTKLYFNPLRTLLLGFAANMRYEGEAGGETGEGGGAGGETATKTEVTSEVKEEAFIGPDGRTYKFKPEQVRELAALGLAKAIEDETRKANPPKEEKKTDSTGDATLADVVKKVEELKTSIETDKQNETLAKRKAAISASIDAEIAKIDVIKDDAEAKAFLRKNVLNDMYENPSKAVEDHVKEIAKVFLKGRTTATTEYAKNKKETADKTRLARGTDGTVGTETVKQHTAADFKSGKVRNIVREKLQDLRAKRFS